MTSPNYAPLAEGRGTPSPSSNQFTDRIPPSSIGTLEVSGVPREDLPALYVQTSNLPTPHGFPESPDPMPPENRAVIVVFPFYTFLLILCSVLVFTFSDYSDCSQPLAMWIAIYVGRHALKTLLHYWRSRLINSGSDVPGHLLLGLGVVDFAGPGVWSLGGYYIFHTETCSSGIFAYACILWGIQSLGLLLPCCFLSTLIFCAPFLVRLAPYLIRPNPNTVAASREVILRLSKLKFSEMTDPPENTSCSICLSDYVAEDDVIRLPCNHVFHAACIHSWLAVSQLCPVDRSNVGEMLAVHSSV